MRLTNPSPLSSLRRPAGSWMTALSVAVTCTEQQQQLQPLSFAHTRWDLLWLCGVQAAADGAARAQAEAAVQRQEALASLEVAASELERVQQQLSVAQVR